MDQNKEWIINNPPEDKILKLSKQCKISALLAKVLLSRGIDDENYIQKFLNPSLDDMYSPYLLKDMEKAVERIVRAIESRERIIIFGDYDVDGITSTSVLYDFLIKHGANAGYYIPDRKEEGYGLSLAALEKIIENGASLIITVDCGITAFEEVRYVLEKNVDIIITDHHECKEELPEAYASINPYRHDCSYPFKELAGVGIVFKLIQALCIKMGINNEAINYLDLVALGTVADVVPLVEENRVIVKYGLTRIENTLNIGLKALIKVSGTKDKKITSYVIGFVLAPRLNAAGRIGDATKAVRLLTTDSETEANEIAQELNEQNTYRQEREHLILCEVLAGIEEGVDLEKEKVIVVWGRDWHHGIIGIVASKITESYNRPCILITVEDGMGKGSGRSIEEFNLFEALTSSASLLEKFGGHELAAGLTIKEENLEQFKKAINEYADARLRDSDLIPKVKIDIEVLQEEISEESVRELELLAPFGAGNPSPVFAYRNLCIQDIRAVGNNKHIKLKFCDGDIYYDAIGFNRGYLADIYREEEILDVACSLEINSWNNKDVIQLNIKDLKENADTLVKNEYFYSLDNAIDFRNRFDDNRVNYFLEKLKVASFAQVFGQVGLGNMASGGSEWNSEPGISLDEGKILIFVNSVNSLNMLTESLKSADVSFLISHNDVEMIEDHKVYIVVNPRPGCMVLSEAKYVFIYGEWVSSHYLYSVIGNFKEDGVFVLDSICFDFAENDIIVQRQDMVVVYQYVKTYFSKDFVVNDLFRFANAIAKNYRINMNYFKLKRIIEIFEELNLLKWSQHGKYGMVISMVDTAGKKSDLESSAIFRSFKEFKERTSLKKENSIV